MRSLHQLFLDSIHEQRSIGAGPATQRLLAAQTEFESDVDVLNYALTLEHLEASFYEQFAGEFDLGEDPFNNRIEDKIAEILEHEVAHVETLTQVITDLGGEPVEAAEYDFGVTDANSFLATAAAVENLGVSAYDGAASAIEDRDLLTAAGSIAAVEGRHAAYLNVVIGESPFPDAFEEALPPEEVLDVATQFIVAEDGEATPEEGEALEDEATPEN